MGKWAVCYCIAALNVSPRCGSAETAPALLQYGAVSEQGSAEETRKLSRISPERPGVSVFTGRLRYFFFFFAESLAGVGAGGGLAAALLAAIRASCVWNGHC